MWFFRLIKKIFWKIMDVIDILWEDRSRLRKAKEKHRWKYFRGQRISYDDIDRKK